MIELAKSKSIVFLQSLHKSGPLQDTETTALSFNIVLNSSIQSGGESPRNLLHISHLYPVSLDIFILLSLWFGEVKQYKKT